MIEIADRYCDLKMPVGILYGVQDGILDAELHGRLTGSVIPGAELQLVKGGHMLPLTQPETSAAFVRRQADRVFDHVRPEIAA